MKMNKKIKSLTWYVPLELNHSSYIYTSALEFCQKHKIRFQISFKNLNKRGRVDLSNKKPIYTKNWYQKVAYLEVLYDDGKNQLLAFDLHDSSTYFSLEALKIADVVYKRCYQQKYINRLPNEFSIKIQKMGLPFMIRPNKIVYKYKFVILFFVFRFKELVKLDSLFFNRLKKTIILPYKQWNSFVNTRTNKDFYNISKMKLSNLIFYQKRLFPNEIEKDTREVHKQRVELIILLKNKFPLNFVGGLKRDVNSIRLYPEIISTIAGDPKEFLKAMKNCGICIYSRGLTNSPGWTLSEFLSQGKCIVAEKLENELPFPLVNNIQVLFFESNEELIEICKNLVSNISEINRLGKNAREYYENYVAPSIFMESILNEI